MNWFTMILERIEKLVQELRNQDRTIQAKLDSLLALEQQNAINIQAVALLEKQNAMGIQIIIGYLTPPVPVTFKATVTRD